MGAGGEQDKVVAAADAAPRRRWRWKRLLWLPVLFVAFSCLQVLVLRFIDAYGEPNHWEVHERGAATFVDFLNNTKYPPSLMFLLMTLGPAAIFCACADRMHGFFKDAFVMFGRVPFAFYVAHFYLLHLLAILMGVIQGFAASQMVTFPLFFPQGYGVNLLAVYGVWLLVIVVLYPFCRWVAGVKARSRAWWLSYL